jgi:hypothetical protein
MAMGTAQAEVDRGKRRSRFPEGMTERNARATTTTTTTATTTATATATTTATATRNATTTAWLDGQG